GVIALVPPWSAATMFRTFVFAAIASLLAVAGRADDLASQAPAVLKKHCAECHHGPGSAAGTFDSLKDPTLTAPRANRKKPYVVPGKPDESFLLIRLEKGTMPPDDVTDRPTAAEKAVVRKWIAAGAPAFPATAARANQEQKTVLTVIRDHLRAAEPEDRPFLRFFTLTHLNNNPNVTD